MDITTTSLLANQLQTLDPKATNAKEQAKQIIQDSADIPLSLTAQKTPSGIIHSNAQTVIGELLGNAVSEAQSKSTIYQALQNHQLFKNMGNFSEDVKHLTDLIKVDSTTAKPLALLQLFAKNIQTIDAKSLNEQVNQSGVFFESKLANIVTQKGVIDSLQTLSTELNDHTNMIQKSVPELAKQIQTVMDKLNTLQELSSKEAQSALKTLLDVFRQSIKSYSSNEPPSSSLTQTYQTVQKLEYAIKQMDLIHSKIENYPASMKVEENFNKEVKVLLEQLKGAMSSLGLDDELQPMMENLLSKESYLKEASISQQITKQVLSQDIKQLNESITHEPLIDNKQVTTLESEVKHVNEASINTKIAEQSLFQTANRLVATTIGETVEENLKMVANKIKQQIALQDVKVIDHANFLDKSAGLDQKIHSLIKPELFVGKAMAQKLSLDPTDVELLSDMKGVLTKLSDSLAPTPQNKEALEITNRLLTQIEYHQLFSYVSSSTHVYIPFSWDGLKGGSMMMKQSSDESFHCQLDLDLEHYGKLNMMLVLSNEKYLDMTIAAQRSDLNSKITDQLKQLKQALNEVGLVVGSIKQLEYKEVNIVKNDYFSGEKFEFGINYKI